MHYCQQTAEMPPANERLHHFSCCGTTDNSLNILHRRAVCQEFSYQERQSFILLHQCSTTQHHGPHCPTTFFLVIFQKKPVSHPISCISFRINIKSAYDYQPYSSLHCHRSQHQIELRGLSLTKKRFITTPVLFCPATRLAPPLNNHNMSKTSKASY